MKKSNKASLRQVMSNNLKLIKIAYKISPEVVIVPYIRSVLFSLTGFLSNTFIINFIINGFQDRLPIFYLISVVAGIYFISFIVIISNNAYINLREHKVKMKISSAIQKMIFSKNISVELGCFEDKEFFDKYIKAENLFEGQIFSAIDSTSNFISVVVSFFSYSFFLVTIDPVLMVFPVIPVITHFAFLPKLFSKEYEYDMRMNEAFRQRDYARRIFYLKDYAKDIRLTNIYNVLIKKFKDSISEILSIIKKYGFKLVTIEFILSLLLRDGIGKYLPLFYAVFKTTVEKSMKYGDCIVIINSMSNLTGNFINLVISISEFRKNSLYIDTVLDFIEYEPKIRDGQVKCKINGDISIKNLVFAYPGQKKNAIDGVSLNIMKGEKIALVGYNGAGKTTLIKLIQRLYDPLSGDIKYCGKSLSEYKLYGNEGYRRIFSTLLQDYKIFSFSVIDNVLLRRKKMGDEQLVERALKSAYIYDKVSTFPYGMNTMLTKEFDDDGEILSGGESQKIALARIFAKENNEIIILDEPSSALDPIAEYNMYESMLKVGNDKTVIYISHRVSSALLADKIYMMEEGKIIEGGTHDELMKKHGKYYEMFMIQAKSYISEGEKA